MAKKRYDDDDGRTVADMDVEGLPRRFRRSSKRACSTEEKLTPKEKKAFNHALLFHTLKLVAVIAVGFILAFFLVRLWLH